MLPAGDHDEVELLPAGDQDEVEPAGSIAGASYHKL